MLVDICEPLTFYISCVVMCVTEAKMTSRLKEDEKNERIIRGLLKLTPNRRCINCNSLVGWISFYSLSFRAVVNLANSEILKCSSSK